MNSEDCPDWPEALVCCAGKRHPPSDRDGALGPVPRFIEDICVDQKPDVMMPRYNGWDDLTSVLEKEAQKSVDQGLVAESSAGEPQVGLWGWMSSLPSFWAWDSAAPEQDEKGGAREIPIRSLAPGRGSWRTLETASPSRATSSGNFLVEARELHTLRCPPSASPPRHSGCPRNFDLTPTSLQTVVAPGIVPSGSSWTSEENSPLRSSIALRTPESMATDIEDGNFTTTSVAVVSGAPEVSIRRLFV
mmetsp:Transcript_4436/g.10268  ORF Transcript_4436/g.10268 Transcript_4436/m.10268 type:complete len:247 (+) Transcript_4436:44-784(+)|eukprot:CAMPEP_0170603218 /NCGR_PEP_ID=MMETSP0224-20130122/18797_1 /TAXON_ID=285029 /ORGANISM="Togula jolla, Strain CCCM 725" /LENGTH=246 /DNA_ID=CAMNT_0010928089 /DNA_START=44 /DNA_END=784 /DNA_ORIENTATION=+